MALFEEELTCAIHLDYYVSPKRMPQCSHSFCERCIDQLPQSRPGFIECPVCRKQQKLPPGGATELNTDLALNNLILKMTCHCGQVSGVTSNCDRCHINYCPDCAVQHSSPVKCRIFTNTESLRKVMTDDFKEKIKNAMCYQWEQEDKIRAMRDEVRTTVAYIREKLDCLEDQLLSKLPDPSEAEQKKQHLQDIHQCDRLFVKSASILQDRKVRQTDLIHHDFVIQTTLERVREPDLLDRSAPMIRTDELFGKLLSVVGCFKDYSHTPVTSVAELAEGAGEPTDVAWNPVDNEVCVGVGSNVHVTARGEKVWSAGKSWLRRKFHSEISDHSVVSLTSHDDGEARRLYLLTQQLVQYISLSPAGFGETTHELTLDPEPKDATDIAADQRGNLYIVDSGDQSVLIFTKDGKLIYKLKESQPGKPLENPLGICVDPYDNVLVTDAGQHCVHIYDSALRYRMSLQDDNNPLHRPTRVAVDRLKRVFVVDSDRKKVIIFDHH